MYQAKYGANKRVRRSRKPVVVLISLAAILIGMVGGTLAYLVDSKNVTNTFTPGEVTCKIHEDFSGSEKENVYIENTGNTSAKIRAKVVATWKDAEGHVYGGGVPTITFTHGEGWSGPTNGYWYYGPSVAPGGVTTNLIDSIGQIDGPDGYTLSVEILADAIQADRTWGELPAGA